MSKRFDVMSPRARKGQDKPYWHRVGTAWEGDKGVSITFDSIPLPDAEGQVRVFLFEPKEKEKVSEAGEGSYYDRKASGQSAAGRRDEMADDPIPF